jgi:hypothetical protein
MNDCSMRTVVSRGLRLDGTSPRERSPRPTQIVADAQLAASLAAKRIREFSIDQAGMHLGRRFRNVTGILTGTPVHASTPDIERAWLLADAEGLQRRTAAAAGGVVERRRSDRPDASP